MAIDVSAVYTLPNAASAVQQEAAKPRAKPGDVMRTEPPVSMDTIIGELVDVSVITSYSIHYTKLYESGFMYSLSSHTTCLL